MKTKLRTIPNPILQEVSKKCKIARNQVIEHKKSIEK